MPVRTKQILKDFFQTGFRPTESNFADLIDSFLHKNALTEDGVAFEEQNLSVGGGVTMGANSGAIVPDTPGTIRWNSASEVFEFFKNPTDGWVELGASQNSDWVINGSDIEYTAGNARVNDAVMGTISGGVFDNYAFFGHNDPLSGGGFAMGQNSDGDIAFSASPNRTIQFFVGNSIVMTLNDNGDLTIPGNISAANFP